MLEIEEQRIDFAHQGFVAYAFIYRLSCIVCESKGPRYVKDYDGNKSYIASKNGV